MNAELEARIKEQVPADDSTSLAEKMLLHWLIRDLKPLNVIETGTHRGLTTLYMAAALEENQHGMLVTCDPNTEWGQTGNFGKFPDLNARIHFLPIMGKDMIEGHPGEIDFAFIDGFHGKDDVIPEIEALMPKLAERAVVVYHDCWYGVDEGVNEAIEELGMEGATIWLGTKNAIRVFSKHEFEPRG